MNHLTRIVQLAAIVLIATITLTATPVLAQTWSKTYLLDPPDFALPPPESVIEASDGSLYSAGTGIVTKLDPYGNLIWSKQFYAISAPGIPQIVETQDGGIVMAAYLGRAPGRTRFTMIKLDPNGNVVWDVDYGDDTGFRGPTRGVEEAPDGSLFLWGYGSYGNQNTDLWLMKSDSQGNRIWDKRYGGPAAEVIYYSSKNFAILPNGNLVLTGRTKSWGSYSATTDNLWVLFLDSQGEILPQSQNGQRVFGGTGNTSDWESSVTVTSSPDPRIVVVAQTRSYVIGSSGYSVWVLEFDLSGNLISQNAYGGGNTFVYYVSEVFETADHSLAMLVNFNNWVLMRISPSGNATGEQLNLVGWSPQFSYPGAMGYAEDGGFLIATRGYGPGNAGTWMLRTDATGGVAGSCDVSATPFTISRLATDAVPVESDTVAADLNLPVERNLPGDPHNPTWYRFISLSTADHCGNGVPRIEASPWAVDFGTVDVGLAGNASVDIRNMGSLDLSISGMTAPAPFSLPLDCAGVTIPSGGFCTSQIDFTPVAGGAFVGDLTITSDDPDRSILNVPLSGVGAVVDPCAGTGGDTDGDGICDNDDVCPLDPENDADSDGICGDVDPCPSDPNNDADGDGICGGIDPCPLDPDNDIDGDGICGDVDFCPTDPTNDVDGDGICGLIDNCPTTPNPNQLDSDGDGIGDACDNRPPEAHDQAVALEQDSSAAITLTGFDPDGDPLTFTVTSDPVNGVLTGVAPALSYTPTAGWTGTDGFTFTVSDGEANSAEATVTIAVVQGNAAPVIDAITGAPLGPIPVGTEVALSAAFTDANLTDTHTAVWDWGDGSSSPGTVDEVPGSGSTAASHIYTGPGVYTVTVTVSDGVLEGSSTYRHIVVYDPAGAFVTGGGKIDSPPGSFPADPSIGGQLEFGFEARYETGQPSPNGEAEMNFEGADLELHSTSMSWMVVNGGLARMAGDCEINGAPGYRFNVTGIDGDLPGGDGSDRVRIRIWDVPTGNVVFDNEIGEPTGSDPQTVLGGGSIVIQSGN